MFVLEWLDDAPASRGIHMGLPDGGWEFRSYRDLAQDVRAVAGTLLAHDVRPGGVVPLLLNRPHEFVPAFYGALLAGCVPSPIATPLAFRSREHYVDHVTGILQAARPAALLADDLLRPAAQDAVRGAGVAGPVLAPDHGVPVDGTDATARDADDLALLQFTSGSSGHPKGVRVSGRNLDTNVKGILRWTAFAPPDAFASWLPVYHDMGLVGALLCPVATRSDLWLMTPDQFLRAPLRWIECFGRHGATMTTAPSFGYAYAARRVSPADLEGMDLSGWRGAIVGAERVDPAALAKFTALLSPYGFDPRVFMPGYGLAEATLVVTAVPPLRGPSLVRCDTARLQSGEPVDIRERAGLGLDPVRGGGWLTGCGTPLEGTDVHVIDEDGRVLPPGHLGEIVVGGPSVAGGYRTQEGDGAPFDPAALRTRDAGFLLDGELYVLGRIGDSLKVRGRHVYAEDVEADLTAIDGVRPGRSVVVFGSTTGEDVAAVIVESTDDGWVEDTRALLRSLTGAQVRIRLYRGPLGSIPRTSSGKPRRRVIWSLLTGGAGDWEPVDGLPAAVVDGEPAAAVTDA